MHTNSAGVSVQTQPPVARGFFTGTETMGGLGPAAVGMIAGGIPCFLIGCFLSGLARSYPFAHSAD